MNLLTWGAEKQPVSSRTPPPTPVGELGSDGPQWRPKDGAEREALGVRKAVWAGLKLGRMSLKEVESGEEAESGKEALRLLRKSTR